MAPQPEPAPQQAGKRRVSVHDAQAKGAKCIGPKLVVLTGQDVAKRNPGGGREALSDEERRAVEGLLSYDEGLASPSRNMAWSPAKCSDWQVRRDCYYGAAAIESPRSAKGRVSYKLQVTSYKLQATSYKLQAITYKLFATSYEALYHL